MGIFGDGKKKEQRIPPETIDIPRDIDEIRSMVTDPTNVRMSHVREPEQSDQPVWKEGGEDFAPPEIQELPQGPEPQPVMQEAAQSGYAPLFIKIDRYRGIISSIGYLKSVIKMMKTSFTILKEIDTVREQTMSSIRETLNKVDGKLSNLDKELVRPTGLSAGASPSDFRDVYNVEATVADLKGQISQLKGELKKI